MNEYKIEKGIPIPSRDRRFNSPFTLALDAMGVGDSIFESINSKDHRAIRNKYAQRCHSYRYNHGKSKGFVVRVVDGGVRIWRTK